MRGGKVLSFYGGFLPNTVKGARRYAATPPPPSPRATSSYSPFSWGRVFNVHLSNNRTRQCNAIRNGKHDGSLLGVVHATPYDNVRCISLTTVGVIISPLALPDGRTISDCDNFAERAHISPSPSPRASPLWNTLCRRYLCRSWLRLGKRRSRYESCSSFCSSAGCQA